MNGIPWTLQRTVEPTELVVSPEALIAHLRGEGIIDQDSPEQNDLMEKALVAEDCVEGELCRALNEQTFALRLDEFPSWEIKLPRPPLISVTSVQYVDENGATQTLGASIYTVDTSCEPGRLYLAYQQVWPTTRSQPNAVTVTYKAGLATGTTPEPRWYRRAKLATLLLAATLYQNREMGDANVLSLWRETPFYEQLMANVRCPWEPLYT